MWNSFYLRQPPPRFQKGFGNANSHENLAFAQSIKPQASAAVRPPSRRRERVSAVTRAVNLARKIGGNPCLKNKINP